MVRPILFKGEMVRAILEGNKTATRRIVKPQLERETGIWDWRAVIEEAKAPCRPGDILYVRETWCRWYLPPGEWVYRYKATDPNGNRVPTGPEYDDKMDTRSWHPSIHMPKEAARIWLKVTGVRVERLHNLTNRDAKKEGIHVETDNSGIAHRAAFMRLWDSTIRKLDVDRYGWNANPWVWVIEFECCEKPENVDLER